MKFRESGKRKPRQYLPGIISQSPIVQGHGSPQVKRGLCACMTKWKHANKQNKRVGDSRDSERGSDTYFNKVVRENQFGELCQREHRKVLD